MEQARRKLILEEAMLCNSGHELVYAVVKMSRKMKGKNIKERERELNKAINEFFAEKIGIKMSLEHFEKRLDPDYSEENT